MRRIAYVLWQKHYSGGPSARLRAFWHHILRGYRFEICGGCGRPVKQVWLADSHQWRDVMGGEGGTLCIPCFDAELEVRGVYATWCPTQGT